MPKGLICLWVSGPRKLSHFAPVVHGTHSSLFNLESNPEVLGNFPGLLIPCPQSLIRIWGRPWQLVLKWTNHPFLKIPFKTVTVQKYTP